jgi:hypothetical protein
MGCSLDLNAHLTTPDPLPQDLTAEQWQRLLVSAIYLLQNSTNLEVDLEYSRWLVEQWQMDQQRIIHQQNDQSITAQVMSL